MVAQVSRTVLRTKMSTTSQTMPKKAIKIPKPMAIIAATATGSATSWYAPTLAPNRWSHSRSCCLPSQ